MDLSLAWKVEGEHPKMSATLYDPNRVDRTYPTGESSCETLNKVGRLERFQRRSRSVGWEAR